jgi:CubicO group peptidase (beta-lactamase class C family)
LIGGIVEAASGGEHIAALVQRRVAAPLGVEGDMYLGMLPPDARARLAPLLPRRRCDGPAPGGGDDDDVDDDDDGEYDEDGSVWRLTTALLGALEAIVMSLVGNAAAFLGICLPSSNGVYTAKALAKVIAAGDSE